MSSVTLKIEIGDNLIPILARRNSAVSANAVAGILVKSWSYHYNQMILNSSFRAGESVDEYLSNAVPFVHTEFSSRYSGIPFAMYVTRVNDELYVLTVDHSVKPTNMFPISTQFH